jgi:hypothetical protein
METKTTPAPTMPSINLAQSLEDLLGDMANVQELPEGFKIKVYHTRAFPWDDVFKMLLYRDYKVNVSRRKADIYIEALI